jgi:hypothetical protein
LSCEDFVTGDFGGLRAMIEGMKVGPGFGEERPRGLSKGGGAKFRVADYTSGWIPDAMVVYGD